MLIVALSWPLLTDPTQVMVADVIRAAVLIACALVIGGAFTLLFTWQGKRMSSYQRSRFLCLVFVSFYVAGTEIGELHRPVVIWRLPLAVLYLMCAIYGVWGMRHGLDRFTERRKVVR